ncbi:molybdopterin biosynthesis protein [Anaerovorax odorimutans]|uniref:molybdopterin biosynthesis protein n=1 Tax=Anaerovorax odorimutans TaxID=109327 RepID=UPI0004235697|nr:molybdopterin biosynthesis protein [Anaerovorax odorimutans]
MERNIYLSNTDIDDAIKIYLKKISRSIDNIKTELVDIREANGRITSKPVFAKISSPNHNAAAMDGIMVIAERTYSANEANPIVLKRGKDFEYINTGHLILEPYNSVIMIEDVVPVGDEKGNDGQSNQLKIRVQSSPWQHIRPIGEDIVSGEMILPENHQIRAMDIGAVLSGGQTEVEVYEKIRVGIMPTGNEITDSYENLEKGMLFDTNSWTFKAIVEDLGGVAERISPVEDDYENLKTAILNLIEKNHMVIVNAGSSAGSKDFTSAIIEDLGELILHGIAIKPGKPTILGIINDKPVIGVPGYPGSAFLVFEEVVTPVIRRLQRTKAERSSKVTATISKRVVSSLKYREYVRVKLGKVGEKLIATPLKRGAGVTMALVEGDGIMIIPKNSEGFEAGEEVSVELINDMSIIENTIVSIGSHDLIMDYIGSILSKDNIQEDDDMERQIHLSSAHVGSMGGILALKRGEAHLAPIHLLDEKTGEYNTSYIAKYLGSDVELVKGVKRVQGFMVSKGNPKNIRNVEDLIREDVSFVNRQKGSGTRILTDYLLKQKNLQSEEINGYDRDMTTHMAVAAAVESGTADVGVGVYSAAKAMNLDFIPIGNEEYDFAVPKKYMETYMIKSFIKVLRSEEFKKILVQLGGYEI